MPIKKNGKEKERKHIRGAHKTCGYPNFTFFKRSRADREEERRKLNNIVNPYVVGISKKPKRILRINIISWFTSNLLTH